MKRLAKILLVLSLLVPSMAIYSYNSGSNDVAAKTQGYYTYEEAKDNTITITNYSGSEKNVTIPSEIDGKIVKKIGYSAFAECKSIETIVVPETVTIIDAYAFSQCSQLRSIELDESIVSIGKQAFTGCISLQAITIPSKIKGLSYGTFFDCISLKEINLPEGLQSIGEGSFGNCRALTKIDYPSTLNSIEGNAFTGCISLESINLPEGLTFIGSGVYSGCISLSEVTLPQSLRGIGQSAFQDCVSLESIAIPNNVSGIGYSAFSGCSNLKQISIPSSLNEIGNALFSGCSSLSSITIPENISVIGEYAFSGCTNLVNIEIPNSVTEIGGSAFSYCSSLKTLNLPNGLNVISASLLRYCTSLETLIIPKSVTKIEATALADCSSLLSVTIPNTVKELGSRVFSNSPLVVLRVEDGSEGYRYAVNNSVKYSLLKSGINLDKTKLNLKVGDSSSFSVIVYPYTIIENTKFTWSSSNPSVASIQNDGVITGLSVGETVITVKNENGQTTYANVVVDDVEVAIEKVTLNYSALTLKKDASTSLRVTINPSNTTMDKNVVWKSSDESVVSVNSTGMIKAKYPGKATISATSSNGIEVSCEITVISEIKSVSLNQTAIVMEENTKQSLRASINPIDTTDARDITWVSSNTNVATVDDQGLVTSLSKGTATISAITVNNKRAECKVTVIESEINVPITSVSLDKEALTLKAGKEETLVATINPSNTTDDKTLVWSSSNEEVATVKDGKVTAINEGNAIIKVATSNGLFAECSVTVFEINKDALEKMISEINGIDVSLYTTSSVKVLEDMLTLANDMIKDENATQEEINNMVDQLDLVSKKLVLKATSESILELETLANKAIDLSTKFTTEDFANTEKLIVEVEALFKKPADEITSNEVSLILESLKKEVSLLEEVVNIRTVLETVLKNATSIIEGDTSDIDGDLILQIKSEITKAQAYLDALSSDKQGMEVSIEVLKQLIIDSENKLDKSLLLNVISLFYTYDSSAYSPASWSVLVKEVKAGEDLLNSNYITQAAIELQYSKIIDAFAGLKVKVDLTALKFNIEMAQEIIDSSSQYKAITIRGIDVLVKQANALVESKTITQEEVKDMNYKLIKAIMKARLK